MYTGLNSIYEGEIIDVQSLDKAITKNGVRYVCRVKLAEGQETICHNVIPCSMFGGIDDYLQSRLRATTDLQKFAPSANDDTNDKTAGCRVYIFFLGGHVTQPRIFAYEPHPNQTLEYDDPTSIDPQTVLKFNGMRFDVTDTGSLRVTHFGLPTINTSDASALAGAGVVADLAGAAAAAGAGEGGDKPNPLITPASTDVKTFFEFLDDGSWRVVNSQGNLISIDPTNNRVYLSDNDNPSTSTEGIMGPSVSTNNTDAEYLLLDGENQFAILNARSKLTIYSFGVSRWVSEDDYTMHLLADAKITIDGDKHEKVSGDWIFDLAGDNKYTVSGDLTMNVKGDTKVTCDGDMQISSSQGGKLHIADTISLGVGGTEVLATLSKTLVAVQNICTAIVALTVGTIGGPSSPPINSADFQQIQQQAMQLQQMLDAITG